MQESAVSSEMVMTLMGGWGCSCPMQAVSVDSNYQLFTPNYTLAALYT